LPRLPVAEAVATAAASFFGLSRGICITQLKGSARISRGP